MKIFDSHAHYDDEAFDPDREALIGTLREKGVSEVLNVGASFEGSLRSIEFAQKYDFFYAAAGIHPEYAEDAEERYLPQLEALFERPKVLAVGEIGLDYHWAENPPRETQKRVFEKQIELAMKLGKPIIVHDRDAHADTLEILRKYHPEGVMHCFSGSVEMMREILSLGMYLSLGGAVTFKNAKKAKAVAAAVPADRLLLETDCPYMAPEPNRGKRCDSSMIRDTAAVIAELRGEPVDLLVARCRENTLKMLRL